MSFLGSTLGFEAFNAKDMWNKLRQDPKRAVLGVDPLSTKAWNAVLGEHKEPIVDQLGGAYGGHVVSAFGNKDGGVYKRAQDAGIDTKAGGQLQDAAHVISAIYGGNGLYGAGGGNAGSGIGGPFQNAQGFMGSSGSGNLGLFSNGGKAGLGGLGGGNAGALANAGGISGGAGYGAAGSAAGPGSLGLSSNWQTYAKAGQGLLGQPQQQQQSGPKPYLYKGNIVWL